MPYSNLKVRTIESSEEFATLQLQWNELLTHSTANTIFLTWEWLYTWWQHFQSGRKLAVMLIEDDNRLVGIAPFFREQMRVRGVLPMQSLQWLGIGEVGSDYLNLICEPGYEDQVCQIVGDEICQNINQWDLLRLTDLPTQCLTYTNLLTRFATNKGFSYQPGREYICPYIPLSNYSWASFFEGLSENTRYNLRRRKRQVFEALGAEIKCCEDMTDVKPFLNSIFELHAQRWQARGGSDGFSSPQVQAFHQDVAARLFAKGWLKLYLMESKGQPIAGIYGLEYGDTFSFYQSGMSPQWDRYSVGMVLLGETIKESFSRKLAIYDFLHGTEEYKFKWTKTLRHTSSLMVCPRNRLAPNFYFWLRTLKQKFARPNLQAAS